MSNIFPSSENGAWLMEIETPPNKQDLLRTTDAYGREGKSYESGDNIIPYQSEWLKLSLPEKGNNFVRRFMGLTFTIRGNHYAKLNEQRGRKKIVSIIGYTGSHEKIHPLHLGRLVNDNELGQILREKDTSDYIFLTVEVEDQVMKLSDYVASFIANLGVKEVFAVSGGGAMHLVDSIGKHEQLNYISTHHEQAAAMAAEAYARISRSIGVALVTTGPGGTNALTGVVGAWIDSIPTLFISGQVTRDTLLTGTGLRQFGIQECDIVTLVKSITKYAVTITDGNDIRYEMEKAAWIASSGRPGPVWVDIPLDIQSWQIEPSQLRSFHIPREANHLKLKALDGQTEIALDMLCQAERPVLICGYGIHLAKSEEIFIQLIEKLNIPIVSSWTASDLMDTNHDNYLGRSGIFGDRASNFAVQNADLLFILGSRMSIPQVGYNYQTFAREARIFDSHPWPVSIGQTQGTSSNAMDIIVKQVIPLTCNFVDTVHVYRRQGMFFVYR